MSDSRINQILAHLAGAASVAADGVTDAVQSAGAVVEDKYNSVKVGIELGRLQEEQKKLFCDIGRTMFQIKNGSFDAEPTDDGPAPDAQEVVDSLLLQAEEKQIQIDDAIKRLAKLTGDKVCQNCGRTASNRDMFCSACGAELPHLEDAPPEPPPSADEGESDAGI